MVTFYINKQISKRDYCIMSAIIRKHRFGVRRMTEAQHKRFGLLKYCNRYTFSTSIPADVYACHSELWNKITQYIIFEQIA